MSEITPKNRMRRDLHRMAKLIPILKVQPKIRSWQNKGLGFNAIRSEYGFPLTSKQFYTGWQSNMLYT